MSASLAALLYLLAGALFIMALRGLSSPESARQGNIFGMSGMAIAILLNERVNTAIAPIRLWNSISPGNCQIRG